MQKQTSAKREIVVTQSRGSFLLFIDTLDRCKGWGGSVLTRASTPDGGSNAWEMNENKSYRG